MRRASAFNFTYIRQSRKNKGDRFREYNLQIFEPYYDYFKNYMS